VIIIVIIIGNKNSPLYEQGARHSLHFASSSLLSIRSFIHSFARSLARSPPFLVLFFSFSSPPLANSTDRKKREEQRGQECRKRGMRESVCV
jgi:hypothetical protein